MEQKLSQVQGVGQVNAGGGALPSVRVEANPTQLASYGLTLAESSVGSQPAECRHAQRPDLQWHRHRGHHRQRPNFRRRQTTSRSSSAINNGAAIHLSDVADVTDSVQNIRTGGYLNGKRAVMLIIFRQPGANIIQTVDAIKAQLAVI